MDEPKPTEKEATALDLKQIKQIVALMAENDLSYFHFENQGSKIELRRGSDLETVQKLLKHLPTQAALPAPAAVSLPTPAAPLAAPAVAAAPATDSAPAGPTINSPMAAPSTARLRPANRPSSTSATRSMKTRRSASSRP